MKIITLMENTACRSDLAADHGLSLYIETAKHKILFDMGPDNAYIDYAEKLGVDLKEVDIAILSHGHYDHGGGLPRFRLINDKAKIYLHRAAFKDYYVKEEDGEQEYIGLDQSMSQKGFQFTGEDLVIDEELSLFAEVEDRTGALAASAKLFTSTFDGLIPDRFAHEQNLLIRSEGKTVLIAGCAHCGIVNILNEAKSRLGQRPDVTFGGFHLFQLEEGDPAADTLIEMIGTALLAGETVYYTGHCTGDYAYEKLNSILGGRLHRVMGGTELEL